MLLLNASERKPQPQESAEKAAWQQSDSRPLLNDSIRQLSPLAKCQDAPIPVCYSDQLHTHDEGWRNLSSFASFQRDGAASTNGFRACYVPRAVCKGSEKTFFSSIVNKKLTFNLSKKKRKQKDYCYTITMVLLSFGPLYNVLVACCICTYTVHFEYNNLI